MKLKIIDKYIIRMFLSTFFYSVILFLLIAIVIDISEKLDDFIDSEAPLSIILSQYYINFAAHIGALLSPLFIFIAVIFFTSRMASRSEFIALLSSGVSFNRLLRPYFISATILTVLLLLASHWLVPNANKNRLAFEYTYIKNPFINTSRNIHLQIDKETFIYLENYNNTDSVGYKFTLEVFRDGELKSKLRADKIEWNREKNQWRIYNLYHRFNDGINEELFISDVLDTTLNFDPADFERRISIKEAMTTKELNAFLDQERPKGTGNLAFFEVEEHKRTSIPLSTYILTLIAVCIAQRRVRGGLGLHIAFGLGISSAYILFMQISSTLSTNSDVPAILGVWLPNILFGILAFWLYRIAAR